MDFEEAIKAHSDWKLKLQRYIKGMGDPIDSSKLSRDDVCPLGCWIYNEGQGHKHNPDFQNMVQAHKEFHTQAADIVKRKDKGENVRDEIALGAGSAFTLASEKVVSLLMTLKRTIKK
ncbi:MAG: hypothetical protein CNLJKLNK_00016 [Holosporales bacterium]